YSPDIQAKLATIIAIQEVGGIVKGSTRYTGWRRFTQQTRSDLLAHHDVYLTLPDIDPEAFDDLGIISKNVIKAGEVNERLNRDLGLGDVAPSRIHESETDQLLRSIVAGQLHEIWAVEPNGEATHIATKQQREISSSTVVRHAGLVVGTPFDLQVPTGRGLETLHLVNDVTAVQPQWLAELAPELFAVRPGKIYFDAHYGTLATRTQVRFNGKTFEASGAPVLERTPQNKQLFQTLYSVWLHERLEHERQFLQSRSSRSIPHIPLRQVQEQVRYIAPGAVSLLELDKKQRVALLKLANPETFLGERFMASLKHRGNHAGGHDHSQQRHKRHRWQPEHKRKHDRHHNWD
ncbi:MAG TPA: hypothetical protein VD735_01505, partial [Candidatus Saccharimonadales bacterium]|nr:hypothetical protein [Candidatus Saccharimonadales bacterium]